MRGIDALHEILMLYLLAIICNYGIVLGIVTLIIAFFAAAYMRAYSSVFSPLRDVFIIPFAMISVSVSQ